MELIREIATCGLGISGVGIFAQAIPIVPDDLKSWPAVAIVGLIALCSIALLGYTVKAGTKNMTELAGSLGKMTEQERERGRRADELCRKLGETNTQMATTNERLGIIDANLKARPCFKDR